MDFHRHVRFAVTVPAQLSVTLCKDKRGKK